MQIYSFFIDYEKTLNRVKQEKLKKYKTKDR